MKPNGWGPDVISQFIKDNETWNECPQCHATWKTEPPIPGLIHKTRLCVECTEGDKNEGKRQ